MDDGFACATDHKCYLLWLWLLLLFVARESNEAKPHFAKFREKDVNIF